MIEERNLYSMVQRGPRVKMHVPSLIISKASFFILEFIPMKNGTGAILMGLGGTYRMSIRLSGRKGI